MREAELPEKREMVGMRGRKLSGTEEEPGEPGQRRPETEGKEKREEEGRRGRRGWKEPRDRQKREV